MLLNPACSFQYTAIGQVAPDDVETIETAGMADVALIVNRHSAGIDVNLRGRNRNKLFFFAGKGIIYMNGHEYYPK
jgi:hypothetical protein